MVKFEIGVRVFDLATQYNMAKLTIPIFLQSKDVINAADFAKHVTSVISKQKRQIMDKVEKLIFIKEANIY